MVVGLALVWCGAAYVAGRGYPPLRWGLMALSVVVAVVQLVLFAGPIGQMVIITE